MKLNFINLLLLIALVVIITLLTKKMIENFCIDTKSDPRMEYESYYNTGYPLNSIYKDSFKTFLDKVDKDKEENHSALGSVQNPMNDRMYNTRILYQPGEDVFKF